MTRLIDPLVADLQLEHADAVRRGRHWESRRIQAAGWVAFIKVMVVCMWTGELAPRHWTPDDRRALVRTLVCSTVLSVAMAALIVLPQLSHWLRISRSLALRRVLYSMPEAFALAVSISAILGVLFGVGGRAFSRRVSGGVVALALLASVTSLINLGWVRPAANQAIRVTMYECVYYECASGRGADIDIPGAMWERTVGALGEELESFNRGQTASLPWSLCDAGTRCARSLAFEYHRRLAVSFSPLAFTFFALSLAAGGSLRRWVLAIIGCAAFFGYNILLDAGRPLVLSDTMPAYVSTWSPNVALVLAAALLTLPKSRTRVDYEPAAR